MKRLSLMALLIFLALQVSALELSEVVDLFKSYVEDYERDNPRSELIASIKNELVNLAVYRFYKIQMVGSLEKRELSLTSSDFLTKLYDRYQLSSLEEKIAFSAFLAYLVSDLRGESLDESTVMKMPAFSTAFNLYRMDVRNSLRDILTNDLLYLVGLSEKPVLPSLAGRQVAHIEVPDKPSLRVEPATLKRHEEILGEGLTEGLIQTAKDFVQRLEKEGQSWNARRILAEARRAALELINQETGKYQKSLASTIVAVAPKKLNLGWLRFLVYGGLISVFLSLKRTRKFLGWTALGIAIAEALYMFLIYDPVSSIVDSYIYAITAIPAFIFATLLFITKMLKRKSFRTLDRIVILLGIVAVFLGFWVSAYHDVPELRMDRFANFHDSVYYEMLQEDVYTGSVSPLKQTVVELKSLISKEVNQTQDTVRKLTNFLDSLRKEGAVSDLQVTPITIFPNFPNYSNFFEIGNGPQYRKKFSELTSILNNFTAESKIRYRRINRAIEKLERDLQKVILYADETFREEVMNSLKDQLSRNRYSLNTYNHVAAALKDLLEEQPISASVKVFQIRHGIIAVLALALAVTITIIRPGKIAVIMGILSGVASLLTLANWKNMRLFVQQGVPVLITKVSDGFQPWYFILVMLISILLITINLRREAQV